MLTIALVEGADLLTLREVKRYADKDDRWLSSWSSCFSSARLGFAVHIEISSRHATLGSETLAYIREKAEKLPKYFDRVMEIDIAVDHHEHHTNTWDVEILVSAEHKHDFVAKEEGPTPQAAMDLCVHKIEQQLRRYKERVQNHKGEMAQGGTTPTHPVLPIPPESK